MGGKLPPQESADFTFFLTHEPETAEIRHWHISCLRLWKDFKDLIVKKFGVAVLIAASAVPASATVVHYTLQDVTFSDGGSATGSFDYDGVGTKTHNIDITTSGGNYAGAHYTGDAYGSATFGFDGLAGGNLLQIIATEPSTLSMGGTFSIGSGYGYNSFEQIGAVERALVSGSVTSDAVPEPAMLGLFGLGAIGLGLSRRRKS